MRKIGNSTHSFLFCNPTNETIKMMFAGVEYEAQPFEKFEVDSIRMAKHFEKNYKYKGLINITYTDQEKAKFKNEKDFLNAKYLEGLNELKKTAELTLAREQQAVNESNLKNGSSVDNITFKVAAFKEKLKNVETAITDFTKKANEKKNESRPDQNSGSVQA